MTSEEFAALQARMKRRRERASTVAPEPHDLTHTIVHAPDQGYGQAETFNKYGAKHTLYNGRTYDSKAEATMAARLDLRVHAGELASWRPQVTLVVTLCVDGPGLAWAERACRRPGDGRPVLRCRVDFELTHPDGRVTFLEVKGYRVRDWALRLRILRLAGVPIEVTGERSSAAARPGRPKSRRS